MTRAIDKLTSEREQRAFDGRRRAVQRMAGQLGLDESNAVLLGGGAFAVHRLNTHVPKAHDYAEPFDLEGYVSWQTFVEMNERKWGADVRPGLKVYIEGRTFSLDAMFFYRSPQYERQTPLPADFDAAHQMSEPVEGISVLPIGMLAEAKLAAGRVKDVAGILKAHVFAHHEEHAVTSDPEWLSHVGAAMAKARNGEMQPNHFSAWRDDIIIRMPRWMNDLVEIDFELPAFEYVPRVGTQ